MGGNILCPGPEKPKQATIWGATVEWSTTSRVCCATSPGIHGHMFIAQRACLEMGIAVIRGLLFTMTMLPPAAHFHNAIWAAVNWQMPLGDIYLMVCPEEDHGPRYLGLYVLNNLQRWLMLQLHQLVWGQRATEPHLWHCIRCAYSLTPAHRPVAQWDFQSPCNRLPAALSPQIHSLH